MVKKFTQEDYEKLFDLGEKLLPLSVCGPKFGLTDEEFLESYNNDKNAKKSYQTGRTERYEKNLETLQRLADSGDLRALKELLNIHASAKEEVKKSEGATTVEKKVVKKKTGLEHLTNPLSLIGDIKG